MHGNNREAGGERNVGNPEQALDIAQPTLAQQFSLLPPASGQALAVMQVLYAQFFAPAKPSRRRP